MVFNFVTGDEGFTETVPLPRIADMQLVTLEFQGEVYAFDTENCPEIQTFMLLSIPHARDFPARA